LPPERAAAPPLADRAAGAGGDAPASPASGPGASTRFAAGFPDHATGAGADGTLDPASGPWAPGRLAASGPPSGDAGAAAPRPIPAPAAASAAQRRWSPGTTLVLTVVLVGGYLLLQSIVGLLVLVPAALREMTAGRAVEPGRLFEALSAQIGLAAWAGIAVAAPAAVAAVWWLAGRHGPGTARRLGLVWPRRRDALLWLLALLAFGWLYERVAVWLDRPPLPPVMEQIFRTAGWLPALVVAVVVLAPAFEELAFRGFCLGGLAPLGAVRAIALSSALFAVIHVQYDLFDMGAVLALGLLFGAARWQSGSTLLTLGLHAFHNAVASVQALWIVGEVAP